MEELFLGEQHPLSGRRGTFEDDGTSAWLYLSAPDTPRWFAKKAVRSDRRDTPSDSIAHGHAGVLPRAAGRRRRGLDGCRRSAAGAINTGCARRPSTKEPRALAIVHSLLLRPRRAKSLTKHHILLYATPHEVKHRTVHIR